MRSLSYLLILVSFLALSCAFRQKHVVGIAVRIPIESDAFSRSEEKQLNNVALWYNRFYGSRSFLERNDTREGKIVLESSFEIAEGGKCSVSSVRIAHSDFENRRFVERVKRILAQSSREYCDGLKTYEIIFSQNVNFAVDSTLRESYKVIQTGADRGNYYWKY